MIAPSSVEDDAAVPADAPPPRRGRRILRWVGRGALALFFASAIGLVVFAGTAYSVHSYDTDWEGRHADAAIVLGASAYHHRPSPVFRERIRHGVELYKSGRVDFLIFTGGTAPGSAYSEAEVGRDYAVDLGVPADVILVEEVSSNTLENLAYAQRVAAEHDLRRFVVVSDAPHLLRAIAMAEDLGMDATPSATPTSRFVSWESRTEFVLREAWQYLGYQGLRIAR